MDVMDITQNPTESKVDGEEESIATPTESQTERKNSKKTKKESFKQIVRRQSSAYLFICYTLSIPQVRKTG